jgi:hypothetical protein
LTSTARPRATARINTFDDSLGGRQSTHLDRSVQLSHQTSGVGRMRSHNNISPASLLSLHYTPALDQAATFVDTQPSVAVLVMLPAQLDRAAAP